MIPILVKRPVAFRIPRADADSAGTTLSETDWRYFSDEEAAYKAAEALGADYQALFVRDGSAIVAEWSPIEYAPKNPEATFLVCTAGDPREPFVVRADILWRARKALTPDHLNLSRLTHWMPLPAPRLRGGGCVTAAQSFSNLKCVKCGPLVEPCEHFVEQFTPRQQ